MIVIIIFSLFRRIDFNSNLHVFCGHNRLHDLGIIEPEMIIRKYYMLFQIQNLSSVYRCNTNSNYDFDTRYMKNVVKWHKTKVKK